MSSTVAPLPYEHLRLEKKDQIAYVTVARPKALNALNVATVEELSRAFTALQQDAEIRVVILTGEGEKAFVAGADITELVPLNAVAAKEYAMRGHAMLELIENLGKPVIACVNGFALGGGCELAMASTIRLASPNARFGLPEVKLGLIPGFAGTQRLPRLVGKGRAMQMLITAEPVSAEEAHRIGLVNEIVPQNELISRAEALARQIMSNAPLAVRFAMEAVNKGMEMTLREGSALEAALFAAVCTTEDKAEGTRAFLEKRPARFLGK